jgi:small-conductance mechanosensitive channel
MSEETEKREVEQIKQRHDVQRALRQTGSKKEEEKPVETRHKLFITTYVIIFIALGAFYYLLGLRFFGFAARWIPYLQRYTRGAIFILLVLILAQLVSGYLIGRMDDPVSQYNLRRVLRLFVGLLIAFIVVSVIFVNWYTAVVSLGLLSLILGFALQTPITSFIGWIYILVREPYRVGDRIKIGDATGDVIDVGYLDTTLWEFGGQYLSTDHPSGRLIKFPNSNILSTAVYNYSWPVFPYIWNEVKFQIGYASDLQFVAETMQRIAEEELGEAMMHRVKTYREVLAQTPVDQLEVNERPSVLFRVSENTWVEAIVRYVVEPKKAGRTKTRLIKKMLEALNAEPERVLFPKGANR